MKPRGRRAAFLQAGRWRRRYAVGPSGGHLAVVDRAQRRRLRQLGADALARSDAARRRQRSRRRSVARRAVGVGLQFSICGDADRARAGGRRARKGAPHRRIARRRDGRLGRRRACAGLSQPGRCACRCRRLRRRHHPHRLGVDRRPGGVRRAAAGDQPRHGGVDRRADDRRGRRRSVRPDHRLALGLCGGGGDRRRFAGGGRLGARRRRDGGAAADAARCFRQLPRRDDVAVGVAGLRRRRR